MAAHPSCFSAVRRVFLYSLTVKGNPTPIAPMLVAIFFCAINGYVQGRYLTNYALYEISWFWDPRFLIGHIVFLLGMAVNVHSDMLLRGLRKPGEKGYKIPYGEKLVASVLRVHVHG